MAKNVKTESDNTTARKRPVGQYFNLEEEKAFFEEVDEEVRNEKFKQLINKYGGIILTILIIALSVAVGYEKIGEWRVHKAEQKNVQYMQALAPSPDYENNIAELEAIVATESGFYKDMARLWIAKLYLDNDKKEIGIEKLKELYFDANTTDKIKEIAAIKLASYLVDTASFTEIESLLLPITQNEDSAWILIAKDLLGMSAAHHKDYAQAKAIYTELLSNNNISDEFKTRINDMLASINKAQSENN